MEMSSQCLVRYTETSRKKVFASWDLTFSKHAWHGSFNCYNWFKMCRETNYFTIIFRQENTFGCFIYNNTATPLYPLSRNLGCKQVALLVLLFGPIDGASFCCARQIGSKNQNFKNESIERGQKTEFKQKIKQDGRHFVNIVHCSVFINCVIRRNSTPIGVIDTIDASENFRMLLCQK